MTLLIAFGILFEGGCKDEYSESESLEGAGYSETVVLRKKQNAYRML